MTPLRYLAPFAGSYPMTRHDNPEKWCLVLTSKFRGYNGQMDVFTRCETCIGAKGRSGKGVEGSIVVWCFRGLRQYANGRSLVGCMCCC